MSNEKKAYVVVILFGVWIIATNSIFVAVETLGPVSQLALLLLNAFVGGWIGYIASKLWTRER